MPSLEQYKLQLVLFYLKKHSWNRTRAALELDIALRTVRHYIVKLKKMGFDVPFPEKIPRKPCKTCRDKGRDYYKIQNNVGQWVCYACKTLDGGTGVV
jgi:hypothetical protein